MSDSEDSLIDQNEYSIGDYYRLIVPLWEGTGTQSTPETGPVTPTNGSTFYNTSYLTKHKLLRTLLDFSLTHTLYLKNIQKRKLEFGDVVCLDHNEGYRIQSKSANSEYSPQFYGALRHKYVEFCSNAALAAYLFSRFHIPDDYGTVEFPMNGAIMNVDFLNVKLLKGSNKLSSISYSQQHKSSIAALELGGINYKETNLSKLLTTQDFEDNEKLASLDQNLLNYQMMYNLAGFQDQSDYQIARNAFEPPQNVLCQIFPFVDTPFYASAPDFATLRPLLIMLRRSLCQDMVYIKSKYPNNPLSLHPIFNSEPFLEFARSSQSMLETTPVYTCEYGSPRNFLSQEGNLQAQMNAQNSVISSLKEQVQKQLEHQHNTMASLAEFISQQNESFQAQSECIQKIQNSTNGLLVLLSSRNSNMLHLAQQTLRETAELYASSNNVHLQRSLNNTMELLARLNGSPKPLSPHFPHPQNQLHLPHMIPGPHQPVHHQPYPLNHFPQAPSPNETHISIPTTNPVFRNPVTLNNIGPHNQSPVSMNSVPNAHQYLQRQSVLRRRLSRQALTLYEMWDDFKGLEQSLKENDITITEWLKVHGSSERQFRHTRLKIIKFVEDEANRRNCSIDYVKEKLREKMRNRQRPWTLDEVQRMLTSGKRINLDD